MTSASYTVLWKPSKNGSSNSPKRVFIRILAWWHLCLSNPHPDTTGCMSFPTKKNHKQKLKLWILLPSRFHFFSIFGPSVKLHCPFPAQCMESQICCKRAKRDCFLFWSTVSARFCIRFESLRFGFFLLFFLLVAKAQSSVVICNQFSVPQFAVVSPQSLRFEVVSDQYRDRFSPLPFDGYSTLFEQMSSKLRSFHAFSIFFTLKQRNSEILRWFWKRKRFLHTSL